VHQKWGADNLLKLSGPTEVGIAKQHIL